MAGKSVRRPIPAAVRNKLFRDYFGNNIYGICQCCYHERISISNFECGHKTSFKNNGDEKLSNLIPLCGLCNKSMGATNYDDFIKKYGFDKNNTVRNTLHEWVFQKNKDVKNISAHVKPNFHSKTVFSIHEGNVINVSEVYNDWLKISLDGKCGWACANVNNVQYLHPKNNRKNIFTSIFGWTL